MEARELRIGNWVNNNEEDYQITSATIAQLERGGSTAIPIPLTEEWLVRFGFECYKFDNGQPNQYRFKDRLIVIRDGKFYDYASGVLLEYVHKFQNFCFETTGEEPTIK